MTATAPIDVDAVRRQQREIHDRAKKAYDRYRARFKGMFDIIEATFPEMSAKFAAESERGGDSPPPTPPTPKMPSTPPAPTRSTYTDAEISRPGVSQEFLHAQGVRRVDAAEAEVLLGFKPSCGGIWIPYHSPFNNSPVIVQGRAFGRLRLDNPAKGAKYLSPKNSGAQLYVPLNGGPFGSELVICEGEFKAAALCEAGIRAVGIGGISSAIPDHKLIPDLNKLLSKWTPDVLYFLGDADTALNFVFSYEAAKLRKALSETSRLALPRIPLAMPNGVDDCREQEGGGFMDFWGKIVAAAIEVEPKPDPSYLSLRILESEWENDRQR